jgi:hypothetical protein
LTEQKRSDILYISAAVRMADAGLPVEQGWKLYAFLYIPAELTAKPVKKFIQR